MPPLEIYQNDDVSLLDDFAFAHSAGVDSPTLEVHVWNTRGDTSADTLEPVFLVVETESLSTPGLFLQQGLPPQDALWFLARVVGFNNAGDPTWSVPSTDWISIGAYSGLLIPSIPGDCGVHVELKSHPPSSVSLVTYRHGLRGIYNEHSLPLPAALVEAGRGILDGIGNAGWNGILRGCELSASGTPDDEVHVAAGLWLRRGVLYGKVASDHQLDQNDGASQPLVSGESYWARLSLGEGSVSVTKGDRAAAPTKTAAPAGEPVIGDALVEFQPGGTSVIGPEDLDGEILYDRFRLEVESGRTVEIHTGQALGGSTHRFRTSKTPLTLPASATTVVYLVGSGNLDVADIAAGPPESGATPLWEVTTDATDVTLVVDLRPWARPVVTMRLQAGAPGSAPAVIASALVEDQVLVLEEVALRTTDRAVDNGATAGQTQVDVYRVRGGTAATIYTSSGTDDQRPAIAFDAPAGEVDRDGVHEVTEFRRSDVVELEVVELPTGGSPSAIEVVLTWRRA